jgi:hypothetical protein
MFDDTDIVPQSQEIVEPTTETQPEVPVAPKESDADRNFRTLREKTERIQRERDDALARIKQYEQQPQPDLSLKPDELAEGKHIHNVSAKINALETQLAEARLRSQYPDIDKVVSPENLALLKERYPEIAQTLSADKNFYSQASSAYTILKNLGLHQDASLYDKERSVAQNNAAKPRPLTSIGQGDSPLSRANAFADGLTDDLKKQLHKEMISAIRSR